MPSHIYTWTGRYDDVIRVNQRAVEVDRAFVEYAGRENFYTLYRLHNFHFVAYGAMFAGRREIALAAARELVTEIPPALLVEYSDFLDVFVGTPYHVLVRFGLWEEILAEPEPAEELFAARAVWRYARGIALATLGRVEEAAQEQEAFLQAKDAVPESRLLFNNPVKEILEVATQVLAGEIEYRRGNLDRAFEHLREAVVLDERLNYDEPWGAATRKRSPFTRRTSRGIPKTAGRSTAWPRACNDSVETRRRLPHRPVSRPPGPTPTPSFRVRVSVGRKSRGRKDDKAWSSIWQVPERTACWSRLTRPAAATTNNCQGRNVLSVRRFRSGR
jgi:hypothetical protein